MQLFVHPLAIAFTLATTAGVVMHDTQLDRATTVALALPAAAAITYAGVDNAIKSGDAHVHVERAEAPKQNIRAATPRLQPRDDDRRYLLNKKVYFGGADTSGLWPSV